MKKVGLCTLPRSNALKEAILDALAQGLRLTASGRNTPQFLGLVFFGLSRVVLGAKLRAPQLLRLLLQTLDKRQEFYWYVPSEVVDLYGVYGHYRPCPYGQERRRYFV